MTVLSVVEGTNAHLIAEVAKLWIGPEDRVMDVTFGKGTWWREVFKPDHPCASFVAHDLALDSVDFRELPEPDESKDVIAFDPPYVCVGGRETSGIPDFLERYGLGTAPRTVAESRTLIAEGIAECARVLTINGRLLVKAQDYISSGQFVPNHHFVVDQALACGLKQVDEFVFVGGPGPQPPGRRQVHSRRAHSFLIVFQKRRTTSNTTTTERAA